MTPCCPNQHSLNEYIILQALGIAPDKGTLGYPVLVHQTHMQRTLDFRNVGAVLSRIMTIAFLCTRYCV